MSKQLRVVIVTESFLPQINGVTNSVLRVLEYLRSQGHEALVIAPESAGGVNEYAGFRVKRVPSVEVKGMLPVGFPQKTLEPLIDGFSPDVVHLASPFFLGYYAARVSQRLGIPTLSIYQTDIAGFARHYGLTIAHDSLKKWVAKIHTRTSRTLAPSNWSCDDLKSSGVDNVYLWQRGVDGVKFSPTKRDINLRCELLGDRPDRKLVGYVGRLANEKRIDDLSTLDKRDDVQLVIVGEGPARMKLERELPNAKFVGYQGGEDLARYYASLDIFVHTGKHETFCQSIQEALASGVPVIAPNSGGPTDLVKHGWTGFLIDTSNSYSLNHSVNQILYSSEHRLMSERARGSVIHRTWESVNSQLIEHYRELSIANAEARSEQVA
jgi:phosphatidylinositol alpha 1,6-mannosyltransferase